MSLLAVHRHIRINTHKPLHNTFALESLADIERLSVTEVF